jgi:hypothetical protein
MNDSRFSTCTGKTDDLAQVFGLRQIIESSHDPLTPSNRDSLNAESRVLFDELDKLCRKCGIFIVPWGSFKEFCSDPHAEMRMTLTLRFFLNDIHNFLSQRQKEFAGHSWE